jgi:hypothetical protein
MRIHISSPCQACGTCPPLAASRNWWIIAVASRQDVGPYDPLRGNSLPTPGDRSTAEVNPLAPAAGVQRRAARAERGQSRETEKSTESDDE